MMFSLTRTAYRGHALFRVFFARGLSSKAGDDEVRTFMQHFSLESIPRELCNMTFSRSSGPGGQNVNKLNTKATLKLTHDKMSWVPQTIKDHLQSSGSQYLTKHGDLVIQSQRARTQEQNKEDCFRKLADIIYDAGHASVAGETSDETKQKVNRMIKKDNERRIQSKKIRSAKKSARKSGGAFEST